MEIRLGLPNKESQLYAGIFICSPQSFELGKRSRRSQLKIPSINWEALQVKTVYINFKKNGDTLTGGRWKCRYPRTHVRGTLPFGLFR